MVHRGCPAIHRLSVNDVLLHQGTRSPSENVQEKAVPDKSRIVYGTNSRFQAVDFPSRFISLPRYEISEKNKLEFRPVFNMLITFFKIHSYSRFNGNVDPV